MKPIWIIWFISPDLFWFLVLNPRSLWKSTDRNIKFQQTFHSVVSFYSIWPFWTFHGFICVVFLHDKKFSLVFLKSQQFSWNKSWCDCHCTNVETEAEEVTVSPEKKDVLYFFLSVSYTSHPGKENYNPKEWHYCKYSFHYFLCGFNSYLTKQLEKADSRHTNQTNE